MYPATVMLVLPCWVHCPCYQCANGVVVLAVIVGLWRGHHHRGAVVDRRHDGSAGRCRCVGDDGGLSKSVHYLDMDGTGGL